MTENLHGIAQGARSSSTLEAGDLVIDIGCNDGTLLDGYTDRGPASYLGFDPSDVSRYAVEKGYDVVNDFFSTSGCARRATPTRRRRSSPSIAMFYDLEHPRDVRRRRRRAASPRTASG